MSEHAPDFFGGNEPKGEPMSWAGAVPNGHTALKLIEARNKVARAVFSIAITEHDMGAWPDYDALWRGLTEVCRRLVAAQERFDEVAAAKGAALNGGATRADGELVGP
jgi:hypothetical protein